MISKTASLSISERFSITEHAEVRLLRLALLLWGLLLLFVLRVTGQLLVAFGRAPFLPPMDEWQSGLLPYRWLVFNQFVIIVVFGKVCFDMTRGGGFFARPRARLGSVLLVFGSLYFASMIIRYVLTMWLYPHRRWMHGCIPIIFHLILASFILLVGHDNSVRARLSAAHLTTD